MPFWRKKTKEPSLREIVRTPASQFTAFIADFIDQMDPATRTHVAVAYQNLIPLVGAFDQHSRGSGQKFEIEDLLEDLADKISEPLDEVSQRRFSWFFFAGLVARLEKLARSDDQVIPVGAAIWTIIITEYPRLRHLLSRNIVWSEDEKLWFPFEESGEGLMELGINHHIPTKFANHEIVKRFAKDLGVFYCPAKGRIGFIP